MTAPSYPSSRAAAERFFRLYYQHCVKPDQDTLYSLLNAIHSLNDRLSKEAQHDFYACNEFVPLQALRNLLHHRAELAHEVRAIGKDELPHLSTDLLFLCLVPRSLVEQAIGEIPKGRQEADRRTIEQTLKWYGEVVNINPCIFNFAVRVYEKLRAIPINLSGEYYEEFRASYENEDTSGLPHFISGDISCLASDVNEILLKAFANVA